MLELVTFQFKLTADQHKAVANDAAHNAFEAALMKIPGVSHVVFGAYFGPYVWVTYKEWPQGALQAIADATDEAIKNYFA